MKREEEDRSPDITTHFQRHKENSRINFCVTVSPAEKYFYGEIVLVVRGEEQQQLFRTKCKKKKFKHGIRVKDLIISRDHTNYVSIFGFHCGPTRTKQSSSAMVTAAEEDAAPLLECVVWTKFIGKPVVARAELHSILGHSDRECVSSAVRTAGLQRQLKMRPTNNIY